MESVIWQSVRYDASKVTDTRVIREYSNGEVSYADYDAKGKKLREWYKKP